MHTHTHIHIHIHIHIHMHMHMHMHMHIQIHIHTYIYTHTDGHREKNLIVMNPFIYGLLVEVYYSQVSETTARRSSQVPDPVKGSRLYRRHTSRNIASCKSLLQPCRGSLHHKEVSMDSISRVRHCILLGKQLYYLRPKHVGTLS